MNVNLTTTPYYDDFDSTKNFYRILFKPGVPVQARELTQIQTILQNQIKRFASHIFVDGARTSKDTSNPTGIIPNVRDYVAVKLTARTSLTVADYIDTYVTGATSNTICQVKFAFSENDPTIGDPPTIVNLIKSGNGIFLSEETLYFYTTIAEAKAKANTYVGNEKTIADVVYTIQGITDALSDEIIVNTASITPVTGDILTSASVGGLSASEKVIKAVITDSTTQQQTIKLTRNIDITSSNATLTFTRKNSSPTMVFSTTKGTFYKNGFFVDVAPQSIVPQKYTIYPNKSLLYRYTESTVGYNDDASLLDPAFGSSNYLAPGADRLKAVLTLDSVDLTDNSPDITDDYIEVARYINGVQNLNYNVTDTQYADIYSAIEQRTYEESGNYIIDDFKVLPGGTTTSGTNNRFFITPGKAYVGGKRLDIKDRTELLVPKARQYLSLSEYDVNTYYGNYVKIKPPYYGLFDTEKFSLKDYWECHNTTNRSAMDGTTLVGYVTPKFMKYESGSGSNSIYKFYWFTYEQASTTLTFNDIRSVISVSNGASILDGNNGTYANPKFFAEIADSSISADGKLIIYETGQESRYVFPTDYNYVKDVTNINTVYSRLYSNVTMSSGTTTLTTSSPNKFVGGAGTTLSNSYAQQYYTVVVREKLDSITLPSYYSGAYVTSENLTFAVDSTKQQLTISHSNTSINARLDVLVTLENTEAVPRTKTLVQNYPQVITISDTEWYSLYKSDIFALKAVYNVGANTTWQGAYNSGTTYAANSYVTYNDKMYVANASTTGDAVTDTAKWLPVTAENLYFYTLDNGQRDTVYDWGRIKHITNTSNATSNVVVVFDYFTHSGDTGPFVATSYPANLYARIPVFKSPMDAKEFQLRDCLDYRIRREDWNFSSSPVTWTSSTVSRPDPLAVPGTQVDMSYYIPRADRLYLSATNKDPGNQFYLIAGTNDVKGKAIYPANNSDQEKLSIATLYSPPYTASSSDVKIVYNSSPRYTMKSIQNINSKLVALEKRVKRQGLEIEALNNKVYDRGGIYGNVLYPTGIFVEDFGTLVGGLTSDPYFTAAIDNVNKICRPAFSADAHKLMFITDPDVSYKNDIITMNIVSEEKFISQKKPTTTSVVVTTDTRFNSTTAATFPTTQISDGIAGGPGDGDGGTGGVGGAGGPASTSAVSPGDIGAIGDDGDGGDGGNGDNGD